MKPPSRIVIRICALLIAGMCLFPPWNEYNNRGHMLGSAGFAFIMTPPDGARLDLYRLLVLIAVVLTLGAGFAFTAPESSADGIFADERKLLSSIQSKLLGIAKKISSIQSSLLRMAQENKTALITLICVALCLVALVGYQNYEEKRLLAETQERAAEKAAIADHKAKDEQLQKQRLQAELDSKVEAFRRSLYRLHRWQVEKIPNSGLSLHFESSLTRADALSYRFQLSGPADQLETAPIYYSAFNIHLINGDGLEVGTISVASNQLVKSLNRAGGLVYLETTGTSTLNEASYAAVTRCRFNWQGNQSR